MTSYLFTMADMESDAEFARRRGSKDKTKRRSRLANAGIAAGGLAGATALGAGARYGGAEISTRLAERRLYNGASPQNKSKNGLNDWKKMKMNVNTARNAASGGAKGQWVRDKAYMQSVPGRLKASGTSAVNAFKGGKGIGGKLGGVFNSGKVGRYGMLGAGVATGGALVGGGIMGAKAYRNRKKKK